jgi:hypothetical protein
LNSAIVVDHPVCDIKRVSQTYSGYSSSWTRIAFCA